MTMQPTVTPAPAAPAPAAPVPVITYVPVINGPKIYDRYLGRQSVGLGIAQIIIGVLCIICNGIGVGYAYNDYGFALFAVGHGFWCGVLFIVTGVFGIGAGTRKTLCQIVAFMVLNIISASFTIALLTVGILGAITADNRQCRGYYGYRYDCYDYSYYPCYRSPCPQMKVAIAMESLLAIFGFIEAIVAIWGSALCCRSGACCCSKSTPAVHVMPGGYAGMPNNGQIIYITQTQGGQYTYSPQPVMPYPQGLIAPPSYATSYAQPGWGGQPPMAATGVTVVTQEPPAYVAMTSSPTFPTGQPANQSPEDQKY